MEEKVIRVISEQADKVGFPDYAMTVFITVLSGVLVFAVNEWLKELWLIPLQNYKKLRAKVAKALVFYSCYYHEPIDISRCDEKIKEKYEEASSELRQLASELRAFIETLSWFRLGIPSNEEIYRASSCLIGLSNGLYTAYNNQYPKRIDFNIDNEKELKKSLGIYKYEDHVKR